MRCIYCLVEKAVEDFNREHVLPEGFGKFKDALVLHNLVCAECNQYFGDTLDLALARSSSEGLERYSWHIKPASESGRFKYGDVIIRLEAPGTPWHDALVKKVPTEVAGESQIELIPQAVFPRLDGSGSLHVPLWELRKGDWVSDTSIDPSQGVRILAPDDLFDEVRSVLSALGLEFNTLTEMPAPQSDDGDITVRHMFALTEDLQRAIAKIGFNYFASVTSASQALKPEFDEIRRFARFGEKPDRMVVGIVPKTRLAMTRADGQVPSVHYMTVEPDDSRSALLAHVSLFHFVVYQVVLTENPSSDFLSLHRGHGYNIANLTCRELTRTALSRDP